MTKGVLLAPSVWCLDGVLVPGGDDDAGGPFQRCSINRGGLRKCR